MRPIAEKLIKPLEEFGSCLWIGQMQEYFILALKTALLNLHLHDNNKDACEYKSWLVSCGHAIFFLFIF